jgi:hypothetical protein
VLYLVNSDPEGLACGPEDGTPRCLEGFACVKGDDALERCVRAGFKGIGEECNVTEECSEDAVCADAWATRCPEGASTSMDCALVDAADRGLRCRKLCNEQNLSCGIGTRCFAGVDDGEKPFCQQGTCATDSDCVAAGLEGLCIEETLGGGRSGLCRVRCEPLRCADRGEDCPCRADESCATPVDEVVTGRGVCSATGVLGEGVLCDAANPCDDGLTCALRSDGLQVCLRWCLVGGGAPACGIGQGCASVDGALGLCQ